MPEILQEISASLLYGVVIPFAGGLAVFGMICFIIDVRK